MRPERKATRAFAGHALSWGHAGVGVLREEYEKLAWSWEPKPRPMREWARLAEQGQRPSQ